MGSGKRIPTSLASPADSTMEFGETEASEASSATPPASPLTTDVVITHEDIDRAHDRERVFLARARRGIFSRFRLLWLLVGPGILVMLGENDGPSMLSYATTGSQFGIGFFIPFVVLTFFMAVVVQEMTVRLGSATHRGHAELIFDRFGPFWGWFSLVDLGIGNFLTLITEFIAIRAGLGFFGVPPWIAILGALAVLYLALVTHRYWTWERISLAAAAFNLVFIPVAFLARPDWSSVGHALMTWRPLPGGLTKSTLLILLADIGATVTPWMLFFQQSATVDKGLTKRDVRFGRIDTALGAALAATAAVATILATAPLFIHHMSAEHFQAAEFAQALEPLVGRFGAALFALGMISMFISGGVSGFFLAQPSLDIMLHATYFVVGHFHLVMAVAAIFGIFAGTYFWFPKMFGTMMNETLGKIHFWLTFVGAYAIFMPFHYLGLAGNVRRYQAFVADYMQPLIPVHRFITVAALATGAAQLIFLYNLIHSRFWGEKAPDNPWQATSLEWSTPTTPPPFDNFGGKLPVVYHDPYQYGIEGATDDYVMQDSPERIQTVRDEA